MSLYAEPVWEDPPAHNGRRSYSDVLGPLIQYPGEWARIGEYASPDSAYQAALNLRKRQYTVPHPDDSWEFVTRNRCVWARYVGSG